MQVRALLNDTVGTLAGGRYSDSNVVMGIILGTGTNGAYVEKISNIGTLPARPGGQDPSNEMVVNTEWGGYQSPLLPMTADDYASDAAGANPGECHFEKLISGYYMGEAVRSLHPCSTTCSVEVPTARPNPISAPPQISHVENCLHMATLLALLSSCWGACNANGLS